MEAEAQSADEDELTEVISVQSEANVLQRAANEIKTFVELNSAIKIHENTERKVDDTEAEASSAILKTKLQEQIRTGQITPFQAAKKESDTKKILGRTLTESTQLLDLEKYLLRQAELTKQKKLSRKNKNLQNESDANVIPTKKIKTIKQKSSENKKSGAKVLKYNDSIKSKPIDAQLQITCENMDVSFENVNKNEDNVEKNCNVEIDNCSGSEYVPSDDNNSEDENKKKSVKKKKRNNTKQNSTSARRVFDDGDESIYKQRVQESGYNKIQPLHNVDKLFKMPKYIWKKLYKYQRVSVKWLWELHTRNLGGLLGDEMGLGKTVQVIAFLVGLDCSELLSDGGRFRGLGPVLIICPATLLEQWVIHFHDWFPTIRTVILHQSGTFQGSTEDLLDSLKAGGVLITSYSGIIIHKECLLKFKWHYVILDEGHKIRNPDAKVSKIVKGFLTPHRLLLTGSPMQNSLKELWSLFDFILPGKLGTLAAFMEHCAGPITRGGYSNASRLQEATALQVATMLKDAITPYMLRRTKYDIRHHISLPEKNEQVLFCSLTDEQRQLYKEFLHSEDVSFVLHERREGSKYRARLLVALTALRKICNHPDLFLYSSGQAESDEDDEVELDENEVNKFGYWKRAGKMTVVRSLLKIWNKQGHRVLLFTQSRQMMRLLEGLVQKEKYSYLRMDGTTPMSQRQSLISKFNKDQSYFVFLLTTRVGGLGVNLTGANRVIIYDPDWNPATDAQARERAWRIGQDKNVTVYRLITAGTIEEKMYHRQVFKILLSNKVLEDPRQRRLFRTTDLSELFNLNEPANGKSESDQLFHGSKLLPDQPNFTVGKIEAMRKLASSLSKTIGKNLGTNPSQSTDGKSGGSKETIVVPGTRRTESSSRQFFHTDSAKGGGKPSTEECMNSRKDKEDCNVMTGKGGAVVEGNATSEIDSLRGDPSESGNKNDKGDDKDEAADIGGRTRAPRDEEPELEEGEIIDKPVKASSAARDSSSASSRNINKSVRNHRGWKERGRGKSKSEAVSALFEGERVSCLIGRRLGRSSSHANPPADISDDQFVLSKLFGKAAVSSAFQHDSVLSSAVVNAEQETLLQRAAKETASEKMDSIRQSRKWCWKPSWDKPPQDDDDDDHDHDYDDDNDNDNDGDN